MPKPLRFPVARRRQASPRAKARRTADGATGPVMESPAYVEDDETLLLSFKLALEAGMRPGRPPVAPRTVTLYLLAVSRLGAWLRDSGRPALAAATRDDLAAYAIAMHRGMKASSAGVFITVLKIFYGWLIEEGIRSDNPAATLTKPKKTPPSPKALTKEEVRRVLALQHPKSLIGQRNTALILVLLDTGIRRSEAAALQVRDVDFKQRVIAVRQGKGGKPRVVPVGAAAIRAIDRYLRQRQRSHPDLPWLWHSQGTDLPLSSSAIGQMHQVWSKALGLNLHAHRWRHTSLQAMLDNGMERGYVQLISGHADEATLQIYTRETDVSRAISQHRGASPADRLSQPE